MSYDHWAIMKTMGIATISDIFRNAPTPPSDYQKYVKPKLKKWRERREQEVRLEQLVQELTLFYHIFYAENKKSGGNEWRKDIRDTFTERGVCVCKDTELIRALDLWSPNIPLDNLPQGSFTIQLTFTLKKPYLSKDEQDFYIIDNPVRKDKVFGLPYVAPTQWKGALRAAIRQKEGWCDKHPTIHRLFGQSRDDDTGQSGYLYFYPTFFNRIGLEVINPHDRKRRVGTNPIPIECVPEGTSGTFTLLYVPLDRGDGKDPLPQAGEDMALVARGIAAMFTEYGFGAKTSSGFGVAKPEVKDACLRVNVPDEMKEAEKKTPTITEPQIPQEVLDFRREFENEDFALSTKGWRRSRGATTSQTRRYREAKAAYDQFKREMEAYQQRMEELEAQASQLPEPEDQFVSHSFESFAELVEKVATAGKPLQSQGGAA